VVLVSLLPLFCLIPTLAAQSQFYYWTNNGAVTITGRCPDGPAGALTIPDTVNGLPVTGIGKWAFVYCASLTNVLIPSSVTNIGGASFAQCSRLLSITVDPLNPFYSSVDGALFDKSGTTLIQCPGAKSGSYTIPDGVTSLSGATWHVMGAAGGAFNGCTGLTSITIPDSVTDIGSQPSHRKLRKKLERLV
jgi:hypothetical protein